MEPSIAEMSMPIDTATADNHIHTSGNSQTEIRVEVKVYYFKKVFLMVL